MCIFVTHCSCSLLDLFSQIYCSTFVYKKTLILSKFLEILGIFEHRKPWFKIAATLINYLYLLKSIQKVNRGVLIERARALLHYSCRRGSYYSAGRTNRGSTVCTGFFFLVGYRLTWINALSPLSWKIVSRKVFFPFGIITS